ncbi:hypothetical protein DL93DRAFT_2158717 [Clavulina sp. PMI_390]|nr:hypothetical protein DL93DRAFT_2158717 [Clavulina sp. PMI_390]
MSATTPLNETTLESLHAALDLMSKAGNGPAPKDLAVLQSWLMSNVHASVLNMLKHIYLLGPTIAPEDETDFVKYGLMWCTMIHAHHHEEETWYFNYLSKAIKPEQIEKEHAKFHAPLHAIEDYLVTCLPGGSEWGIHRTKVPNDATSVRFEAATLNSKIDELATTFLPHFCDEISYLEPSKLRAFVTEDEFKVIMQRADKEIGKLPASCHVLIAQHALNPAFPPAPWVVKNILIPWVFYWPERRIWRFIPASTHWS